MKWGKVVSITEKGIIKIKSENLIYIAFARYIKDFKILKNDKVSFIPNKLTLGGVKVLIAENIKKVV